MCRYRARRGFSPGRGAALACDDVYGHFSGDDGAQHAAVGSPSDADHHAAHFTFQGVTPRESMPKVVQYIMLASPTTHFVMFSQSILYRGAGLEVVWRQFLSIIGLGSVFFTIALLRFRKTIGQM